MIADPGPGVESDMEGGRAVVGGRGRLSPEGMSVCVCVSMCVYVLMCACTYKMVWEKSNDNNSTVNMVVRG